MVALERPQTSEGNQHTNRIQSDKAITELFIKFSTK